MTAEQALSDLTEISSQVEAAALFDAKGKVAEQKTQRAEKKAQMQSERATSRERRFRRRHDPASSSRGGDNDV